MLAYSQPQNVFDTHSHRSTKYMRKQYDVNYCSYNKQRSLGFAHNSKAG